METVTHLFARRLALTLLVLLTNAMAWATIPTDGNYYTQEEYGGYTFYKDESNNYLIRNVDDWNGLADVVAAGKNCSGKTFKMTANIGSAENPVTKTVGRQVGKNKSDRKRFVGIFDGDGHTLTIALNTADDWWEYNKTYCAPFAYTKDATIKNLHVAGTITTSNQFCGGLVGSTGDNGAGTCTIDNCHVSVAITTTYVSSNGKYANHGGFIGIAEGNATVTNSWFDGKFLGSDYEYSSGFMGMNKGKKTIVSNCLFNPSEIQEGMDVTGSWELVHNINGGVDSIVDCYWVKQFGELGHAQGQKVVATEPDPTLYTYTTLKAVDGNIYYIITSNLSWSTIQEALNTNGTTYSLPTSFKAGSTDAALVVPTGVSVTLNMGNHTIDRGLALEAAQIKGYVIKVSAGATLTINGGTITGGHNTSHGGGIYNEGTLIINGTTITGNTSAGHGAGVYNTGTLNIADATITGNAGKQYSNKGLGVYVSSGNFNIQGNVQIHDNYYTYSNPTQVQVAHNIYLAGSTVINVVGKLTDGSSIAVDGEETIPTRVITTNLKGNGSLKGNFTIDDNRGFALYNASGEVKLNAALTINVPGYGDKNGNWVFIASPIVGEIAPTAVANLKPGSTNNYDLYRLNPSEEKWENYKSSIEHPDFKLVNGQGYLYANKNAVKLIFLGDYREDGSVNVDLHEGWNLVGNPFPKRAYVGRAFYKMNDDGSVIVPVIDNLSDYSTTQINACMGIIVKAESSNESITFSTSAPSGAAHNQGNLQIALTQVGTRDNALLDKAIVSFNEGVELGKFYFGDHDASIFLTKDGKEYAVVSSDRHDEMPVNFKAAENGAYTLTVNAEDTEMCYLHLIDNKTGVDVDLLQNPSYRFEANTMDYPSRFRLMFSAQPSNEEFDDEFAFVSNGQIIVNGEGVLQVVDMTGRTVGTYKADRRIAIGEMPAGVYVLRLTNGEKVQTQKIIIK